MWGQSLHDLWVVNPTIILSKKKKSYYYYFLKSFVAVVVETGNFPFVMVFGFLFCFSFLVLFLFLGRILSCLSEQTFPLLCSKIKIFRKGRFPVKIRVCRKWFLGEGGYLIKCCKSVFFY